MLPGRRDRHRNQRVIVEESAAPSTFVVILLLSGSAERQGNPELELPVGSLTTTFGGLARPTMTGVSADVTAELVVVSHTLPVWTVPGTTTVEPGAHGL